MPESSATIDPRQILQLLQACLPWQIPELLAVHAFGSRVQGTQHADSDLDLAILVAGKADPVLLWDMAQHMACELGCDVYLLDLRAASTVMQYQLNPCNCPSRSRSSNTGSTTSCSTRAA